MDAQELNRKALLAVETLKLLKENQK